MSAGPNLIIGEYPGFTYPRMFRPEKFIDRSGLQLGAYLKAQGVVWTDDLDVVDLRIRKAELSFESPACEQDEQVRLARDQRHPTILLIHETQENTPVAHRLADPSTTYSVSPGDRLKRIFHPLEWRDPEFENWDKRLDKICFIGRPTQERVDFIRELVRSGVEVDVFSDFEWPVAYRGRAASDIDTAKAYKYRVVFESSLRNQCHSEKLFLSILSGCVSVYVSDPRLDLDFLRGKFLRWSPSFWGNREEIAKPILEQMSQFVFSSDWEVYSFKRYYDELIRSALRRADVRERISERRSAPAVEVNQKLETPPLCERLFQEGVSALHSGQNGIAIDRFAKIIEILGPIFFVQMHLGVAQMRNGDLVAAEVSFRSALERFPLNHECLTNMAVLKRKQGRPLEAVKVLEKTLELFPDSSLAWRNMGRAFLELSEAPSAIKAFESGLKVEPKDPILLSDLAQAKELLLSLDSGRA